MSAHGIKGGISLNEVSKTQSHIVHDNQGKTLLVEMKENAYGI